MSVQIKTHVLSRVLRHLGLIHAHEFTKSCSALTNSHCINNQKLFLDV